MQISYWLPEVGEDTVQDLDSIAVVQLLADLVAGDLSLL